jgi:glycosyltransferase involved in cell wall biosynthesis
MFMPNSDGGVSVRTSGAYLRWAKLNPCATLCLEGNYLALTHTNPGTTTSAPGAEVEARPARHAVRVLVVFNTPYLYGMERAVIETFDLLRPEIEPLFLMTHYALREDLPVYREVKRRGLRHVFFSDVQPWPRLARPTGVRQLAEMMGAFVRGNWDCLKVVRGQDVLYLPSPNYMGLAAAACLWFRLTGRRVVLHFHGLQQKRAAMDGWSLRLITDAIHNTEMGRELTLRSNPELRRKRNAVLSIRTDASRRGQASEEVRRHLEGRRNIFFAGQVARHKGPDLLLEAMRMLASEFPDLALHIFGGCADETWLRREISSRGLDGAVHYWGYREDVGELMRWAEIQVHPSPPTRFAESFGRTVVEAMAVGVPSVCFRSGVLPEIVEHGRTGWVCENESAAALAEGMRAILSDPRLREQMGRAARRKYETCYDDATVRQKWLNYFCGESSGTKRA